MSWNNGYERKQFDEDQEKQAKEYRKSGMSEEAIAAMHEFDEEAFHSRRAWEEHKQDIAATKSNGEETEYEQSIIQRFFDRFTTAYDTYGTHSRHWWLQELTDPRLVNAIPKLTKEDIELLTLIVIEGYTQKECAVRMHITQRAISYRIKRVLGKFTEK